ncbi:hypothetical protein J7E87_29340 [Streptomyces sp. ISL-1]|uniref:hypothetical protein n=1 Tax=Streptomyces sp. ISL-1 TaxID=2817657 RepID=UPI001BE8C909|nr:hypothetical protein [Streptomyces sp. ISL-1]MBT2393407.1 hypothetical protein [Streptomyces sp. ISL-1]
MIDLTMRDESRPVFASLQMPQQAPPIDRTSTRPGAAGDTSGVEANGLFDLIAKGIGGLIG